MDNFLVQIQNAPTSKGYIIGYADSAIPGRFHKYFKTFQRHIIYRKQNPDRFVFLRGADRDKMFFEFWLVSDGASPPKPAIEYKNEKITTLTHYDNSFIYSISQNRVDFGENVEEPCDWGLDLEKFAESLKADTDLIGYLVVSPIKKKEAVSSKKHRI